MLDELLDQIETELESLYSLAKLYLSVPIAVAVCVGTVSLLAATLKSRKSPQRASYGRVPPPVQPTGGPNGSSHPADIGATPETLNAATQDRSR